jgi:hypothetical protein
MARTEFSMYFTHVAVLGADSVVLAGHLFSQDEEDRITRLVAFDRGEWRQLADLPEIVSALRVTEYQGVPVCWALLRNGVTHHWRGDDHAVEIIDSQRGLFFNDLRQIDGELYACGTGRQVFRRTRGWNAIDEGMFIGAAKPARVLTAVDGFSRSDIFASGVRGEIWHYDGRAWQNLESPTNVGFTRMLCAGKLTYHCGARGVVCRGDLEGWRILPGANPEIMLTDLAECGGRIYVSSEFELLMVDGDKVAPVETGIDAKLDFGSLACGSGQLWSVGGETILRFDGEVWSKFEFPWN